MNLHFHPHRLSNNWVSARFLSHFIYQARHGILSLTATKMELDKPLRRLAPLRQLVDITPVGTAPT